MGAVPLQRAFDLSATFALTLRSKTPLAVTYQVPPLTLGRFLDLMSSDWNAVTASLLESVLIKVESKDPAEIIGRQLAGIDHRAFTAPVCAVVPGMTAAKWEEEGDNISAMLLLDFFHKAHDWPLIAKAIGWGETLKNVATRTTVAAALMSFCRAFPMQSVEQLLATRIEGFFYMRDGATAILKAANVSEEDEDGESADILAPGGPISDGAGLINDPERKSSLWQSIDAADKAVQ